MPQHAVLTRHHDQQRYAVNVRVKAHQTQRIDHVAAVLRVGQQVGLFGDTRHAHTQNAARCFDLGKAQVAFIQIEHRRETRFVIRDDFAPCGTLCARMKG
jgi:hypothetical protein